ncbi:MAG: type II toxin-antitoxin system YafQ family toxin [Janthinobacterium lividum]
MPEQRRANLPRRSDYTRTFVKAWNRLNKAGKLDMSRIKEVMALIVANDGPLGAEWKDHELQGQCKGFRECHVGGDFLLVSPRERLRRRRPERPGQRLRPRGQPLRRGATGYGRRRSST